jgi:ABC-2 type transport system ATP-binding protein
VSAPGTVILDAVSVFYGDVVGLSRVSLELGPGITGLVGPNGSGKTTLMRVLTGLIAPVEGTVRVLGGAPFTDAAVRNEIALVPAESSFFDGMSARRNLEVAFLAKGKGGGEARDLAGRALDLVRLTGDGDRAYGALSRGMRQRVKLGLALAAGSRVVLLDEPFLGVDPPNRKQLRDTILALGESGRTVLISSHVLHEIESLTRTVGVIAGGRLLGFGEIETLLHELRDRHPHRVHIETRDPRALGAVLLRLPHIREIAIGGDDRLTFITDKPETTYRELPGLIVSAGAPVRRVDAPDNTLEAVFRHVTEVGTRRL